MNLRMNLAGLLRDRGLSQYELARQSGVAANHIGAILRGEIANPRIDTLSKLAVALKVSTERLLGAPMGPAEDRLPASSKKSADHDEPRAEHTVLVRIEGVAVGGGPSELGEVKDEDFPLQHHLYRPGRRVVRVYGDSMYPEIHSNDLVLIDEKEKVVDGDIALVRVEGETTIKRVFRSKKKGVTLKADNPRFAPIFPDDEAFEILGKVIRLVERKL